MNLQQHLQAEREIFARHMDTIPEFTFAASQARTIAFIREAVEGMKEYCPDYGEKCKGMPSCDCRYPVRNASLDAVLEILK